MRRYVLKRLIYAVFVIFCVVTIVFFLTRLSGDPARLMAAPDASDEEILELREALGLNKPLIVQYGEYLSGQYREISACPTAMVNPQCSWCWTACP